MNRYLSLWKKLLGLNIRKWAQYRADFIIGITAMAMTDVVAVLFFWILFQNIPNLNGWSFAEVLFILGMSTTVFGIWHTFLAGSSAWTLDRLVRNGDFDRFLLQPVNTLIYLVMHKIDDDGMGDLLMGIVMLIYSSSIIGMAWTIPKLLLLIVLLAGGTLIIFSISLIFAAVAFWTIRSRGVAELFWPLFRFTEYPLEIFAPFIIFIITFVLPLGFISYYPAQIFLGRGMWMEAAYLTPIVGVATLVVAYKFWIFSLKRYSSTGS